MPWRRRTSRAAALATAEQFQPDLMLLDVMMPDMDGGNLATALQANPKLKGVPIVFLTAAITREEVTARHGLVGGQPFLAKPVNLREVLACLQQHLGSARPPAASISPQG